MKRTIFVIILVSLLIIGCLFLLNLEVSTRQGIDHKVCTLKIPLYLKILDFYDRHFNYKWLVSRIIEPGMSEQEKVMALFVWSAQRINEQPEELPVVDDHVWHIIVRGYGTGDQFSDVFTTLCNYANFDAFFARLYNRRQRARFPFSFVKIADKWCVFEPRKGVYFVKESDTFASVEDITTGNWTQRSIREINDAKVDYADYFDQILSIDFEQSHKSSRANLQSPFNRFIYGIKKKVKKGIPDNSGLNRKLNLGKHNDRK